eukprot:TRINITY_DN4192_c0_g2_i1.p1 TRINITY_DN4192_c0_g2~~TRINITY_DN4192_c0_g2_i1.p1  ORF type:complete len:249 (-),score=11.92 TRINITY_DN4192_c0_g2_i1:35-781(-)
MTDGPADFGIDNQVAYWFGNMGLLIVGNYFTHPVYLAGYHNTFACWTAARRRHSPTGPTSTHVTPGDHSGAKVVNLINYRHFVRNHPGRWQLSSMVDDSLATTVVSCVMQPILTTAVYTLLPQLAPSPEPDPVDWDPLEPVFEDTKITHQILARLNDLVLAVFMRPFVLASNRMHSQPVTVCPSSIDMHNHTHKYTNLLQTIRTIYSEEGTAPFVRAYIHFPTSSLPLCLCFVAVCLSLCLCASVIAR